LEGTGVAHGGGGVALFAVAAACAHGRRPWDRYDISNGGYGGEGIDERLAIPNWDMPELDDSAWENASVHADYMDGLVISADAMEPTVKHSSVPAIRVATHGTDFTVEMAEVFTG
jgi:hypothetical protein